jgi:hypothetical protein
MTCPSCGKVIEIPGTRQLRLLPFEVPPAGVGKQTAGSREVSSLGFRMGLASLLLIGSLSLGYGAWLAYDRWRAPIEFGHTEDEFFQGLYDESMSDPVLLNWEQWNYMVESGIPEDSQPPLYFQYARYYEERAPWMVGSLAIGAIFLAAFFGLSFFGSRPPLR